MARVRKSEGIITAEREKEIQQASENPELLMLNFVA